MRLLAVTLVLMTGCSIVESASKSVDSALEIASSPFTSSSAPTRDGQPDRYLSYRRDVRSYTLASLDGGAAGDDYLRGVTHIAELHGISDWEGTPDTLIAIGEAVQARPAHDPEVERLRADLGELDPALLSLAFGESSPAR